MYELISAFAGLTDVELILKTLAEKIVDTFHFDQVEITSAVDQNAGRVKYHFPASSILVEPCDLSNDHVYSPQHPG